MSESAKDITTLLAVARSDENAEEELFRLVSLLRRLGTEGNRRRHPGHTVYDRQTRWAMAHAFIHRELVGNGSGQVSPG